MPPIVDQPEAYFLNFVPPRDELLQRLEAEATLEDIPIVGPVVGELLYILARAAEARRIMELGTATGYSAIYLGRAAAATGGRLVTLEAHREMARRAEANLREAGLAEVAEVVCGDALEALAAAPAGSLDLVFMDIEKRDYARALPDLRRALKTGGLLVADNVAFPDADGFNRRIVWEPGWRAVSLLAFLPFHSPERDGLCLALKIG
jgi:predicted O-methyltransferase YrrM